MTFTFARQEIPPWSHGHAIKLYFTFLLHQGFTKFNLSQCLQGFPLSYLCVINKTCSSLLFVMMKIFFNLHIDPATFINTHLSPNSFCLKCNFPGTCFNCFSRPYMFLVQLPLSNYLEEESRKKPFVKKRLPKF